MVEIVPLGFDWNLINSLVDTSLPKINGIGSALGIDQIPFKLKSDSNIAINNKAQIINTVTNIVAQEVIGQQYLNEDGKKLLELIHEYGGNKSVELNSSVHELADKNTTYTGRLIAKQKLKKFLINLDNHVEELETKVLYAYIESQIN